MPKPRGRAHTTLTETAALVVRVLEKQTSIKMIAPGEIRTGTRRKSGARHLTVVHTTAGLELIITGQSIQRVAVHTDDPATITELIRTARTLQAFTIKERERKPGV